MAPSGTDTVYAAGFVNTAGAVALSIDRGATWTRVSAPPETVFGLAVHPQNAATAFATTAGGVYRTTDAGASWTRLLGRRGMRAVRVFPGQPGTLVAAGDDGVCISYDGGDTWEEMNDGLPERPVHCLEFALVEPFGELRLFAGTAGAATYAWSFTVGMQEPGTRLSGKARFAVSPSVTTGRLRAQVPAELGSIRLRVVDATGRVVLSVAARDGAELDVSSLAAGVYLLVPEPGNGLKPARFAVRR